MLVCARISEFLWWYAYVWLQVVKQQRFDGDDPNTDRAAHGVDTLVREP